MYLVTAEPLLVDGNQCSATAPLPAVANGLPGASGTPILIGAESCDGAPWPPFVIARTWNSNA